MKKCTIQVKVNDRFKMSSLCIRTMVYDGFKIIKMYKNSVSDSENFTLSNKVYNISQKYI